jgi:hypothetical protein
MFQTTPMGRAAGADAPHSAGNAKRNGKVRYLLPDFPNGTVRASRATSWPYFWTVTTAVCVSMA